MGIPLLSELRMYSRVRGGNRSFRFCGGGNPMVLRTNSQGGDDIARLSQLAIRTLALKFVGILGLPPQRLRPLGEIMYR
jgi:hypothetical protein